jgi:CheY-like chemotaxis protein
MSRCILVVEDDEGNRRLVLRMLNRWRGLVVYGAESGEIALELTGLTQFDTVLLDICLPGISGLQTYSLLRGKPFGAALRIIACTARASLDDQAEFLQMGFDGVLTKPFLIEELSDMLWLPAP